MHAIASIVTENRLDEQVPGTLKTLKPTHVAQTPARCTVAKVRRIGGSHTTRGNSLARFVTQSATREAAVAWMAMRALLQRPKRAPG